MGVTVAALTFMLNLKNGKKNNSFTIEQGVNLNQPSRIYVAVNTKKIIVKGEVYFSQ